MMLSASLPMPPLEQPVIRTICLVICDKWRKKEQKRKCPLRKLAFVNAAAFVLQSNMLHWKKMFIITITIIVNEMLLLLIWWDVVVVG